MRKVKAYVLPRISEQPILEAKCDRIYGSKFVCQHLENSAGYECEIFRVQGQFAPYKPRQNLCKLNNKYT